MSLSADYKLIISTVCGLEVSKTADSIFLALHTEETECDFFGFRRSESSLNMDFMCIGHIGRSGICSSLDKREGDGHTPSGIYPLGECFGIKDAPCTVPSGYSKINDDDYWDCDSSSDSYNKKVKGSVKGRLWIESGYNEHLCNCPVAYAYCAMINYNVSPALSHRGSAIFLHCTSSSASTAGCVAIPEKYMISALGMISDNSFIIIANDISDILRFEER